MKKIKYKQCTLEKSINGSTVQTVSWIPEKYAQLGKVLKLQNEDKTWTDGWFVHFVGSSFIEEPIDIHKAVRQHRKNTGDSLPKGECFE
jgi:hypothetical protein